MTKYGILETILTAWLRGVDYAFPFRGLTTDQIYRRAAIELKSGSAAFLD